MDGIHIIDRVSGALLRAPPEVALDGQLSVDQAQVDGLSAVGPVRLFAGTSRVVELTEGRRGPSLIELLGSQSSNELETSCAVGTDFIQHLQQGFTPEQCVESLTFVASRSDIAAQLDPSPIEVSLATCLPALRAVCSRPEIELRFSVEREPVGRARRLSRRASERLTAHTEDWTHRSVTGIQPRVIEALKRDETADTYESRVTARLIDELLRLLSRRIAKLEPLTPLLDATEEDDNLDGGDDGEALEVINPLEGTVWKRNRVSTAWGASTDDSRLREQLHRVLAEVRRLRQALRTLVGSVLYEAVPARAQVTNPVRVTNLFAEHFDYRQVRQLWLDWWKGQVDADTPQQRRDRHQETAAGFDAYVRLLTLGALQATGYGQHRSDDVGVTLLNGPLGEVSVHDGNDGAMTIVGPTLDGSRRHRSRIVALPAALCIGTEGLVDRQLEVIDASARAAITSVASSIVVPFPASRAALRGLEPHQLARVLSSPLDKQPSDRFAAWLVPVSALDLESQERMARVVRWVVLGGFMSGYPASTTYSSALASPNGRASSWLRRGTDGTRLEVLRPPSRTERQTLSVVVEREVRTLKSQAGGTGHLPASNLSAAHIELEEVIAHTDRLLECPICRRTNDPGIFEVLGNDTFECRCVCDATWGLRFDPHAESDSPAGHRIPFLFPGSKREMPQMHGGVERYFGGDVLASPCWVSTAVDLINPFTGRCTNDSPSRSHCARCQGVDQ
jgi:hypothetical protein